MLKIASNQSLFVTSEAAEEGDDEFVKNRDLDFAQLEIMIHPDMVDKEMLIEFEVENKEANNK